MLEHDIFYNRQRSGFEELTSYQPLWWADILEMKANNKFAGLTLDRMADALEQLVKNQFFDSCSESMLTRIELWLGITGASEMELNERRNLVKATWIGNQKISRSSIQSLVYAYCGCSSEVHFTHSISIIANISEATSTIHIGNLIKTLETKIPAHISWECIMNVNPTKVKAGLSIVYWQYDYQLCGLNPDISTLGIAIETDYQVDPDVTTYGYDYDNSTDKATGTVPATATLGEIITSTIISNVNSDGYTYTSNQSGNKTCGEEVI
jgi:hypothetical protein